ncbi:MAG: putative lipid II flippase FtsW [Gammaproteobacteria bacterium]|nr:putative lipid II flippase FtsW [Gammaproteobacteria bacterium]
MSAARPDHGVAGPVPDPLMFGLWAGLLLVGLVAVTSASMELAASRYGDAEHHLVRHGIYMVLSAAVVGLVLSVPTTAWAAVCRLAWPLTLLLLILVLVPGLGREVNGSMRWIGLGPASIQPSELAKFLLVIHLAGYLQRHAAELPRSLAAAAWPFVWLTPPALLLLMEPDLGSAVVIFGAAAGLVLLAGARILHLLLLAAAAGAGLALLVLTQPYRLQRLEAFLDPWAEGVQFGSGYQLTQALIAFGRGEWFGVGLGEGLQKLFYLPEAHTDFIFAVIAEETGVVGALCLCAALAWLVLRGLAHGRVAEVRGDRFGAMLAYGAALMLGVQMLVSLGVNTGLLPTKGLTLPLVSYGGNSLLVSSALVALMMRVDWESRLAVAAAPVARSGRRSAEVAA